MNFNPRTPVGCDRNTASLLTMLRYFNPRTPVGCDRLMAITIRGPILISIHAPQWGATTSFYLYGTPEGFQSTHPSGVRRCPDKAVNGLDVFQSTHPSGVRQPDRRVRYHRRDFNPRTPVGCDPAGGWAGRSGRYFNPRTPVGCDDIRAGGDNTADTFQSTHPSGVRPAS